MLSFENKDNRQKTLQHQFFCHCKSHIEQHLWWHYLLLLLIPMTVCNLIFMASFMVLLSHFLIYCFLPHLLFCIVQHFIFSCISLSILFSYSVYCFPFYLFYFDLLVLVASVISICGSFSIVSKVFLNLFCSCFSTTCLTFLLSSLRFMLW